MRVGAIFVVALLTYVVISRIGSSFRALQHVTRWVAGEDGRRRAKNLIDASTRSVDGLLPGVATTASHSAATRALELSTGVGSGRPGVAAMAFSSRQPAQTEKIRAQVGDRKDTKRDRRREDELVALA